MAIEISYERACEIVWMGGSVRVLTASPIRNCIIQRSDDHGSLLSRSGRPIIAARCFRIEHGKALSLSEIRNIVNNANRFSALEVLQEEDGIGIYKRIPHGHRLLMKRMQCNHRWECAAATLWEIKKTMKLAREIDIAIRTRGDANFARRSRRPRS